MEQTEYYPLHVDLDNQALKLYMQLMNEWSNSQQEERDSDSDLLKEFKRFHLQFTDDTGKNVTLVSINEFARAQKQIQDGQATDELLDPWLDSAIAAHNAFKSPSQQLDRSTYQSGWTRSDVIRDAHIYAALPAFAHLKSQTTH